MPAEMVTGLALLGFLSVFLLFFGIDRMLGSQTEGIESRLDRYTSRTAAEAGAAPPRAGQSRLTDGLNRALAARSSSKQLATQLARADLKLTPSEFFVFNIIAVLIGFLLALLLSRSNLIFALLGGVVGFYIPRLYMRRLQGQRLQAFNNQLGDTLILLANTLRSGYSLLQAMETVSRELPPPMSVEFARVVREIGLGLTIEEALAHLLERLNSDDLDLVITAINVQHEVGGNLAEILDTISHTIRERVRIKGQIQAMTATQRLSGNVVALLPVALGVFMFLFNPTYLSKMWQESCGIIMLITGGVTITIGYFAIQKITDIEV